MLLAVFIYWGWDTATSVNEECEEPNKVPGLAGILATVVLVLIYVLVAYAAQAAKGPNFLADPNNSGDVFAATGAVVFGTNGIGWWALKLLLLAVLSSSAASCQTTILPAARTALSMAMHRAAPPKFGEVHPEYLTPAWSSWLFGLISCAWFAVLTIDHPVLRRQRARLVDHRRRPDDLLLLRPVRHRLRHLLPPLPVQEPEELRLRRPAPAHRRPDPGLPVRALAHGHVPRRLHRPAGQRGWASTRSW